MAYVPYKVKEIRVDLEEEVRRNQGSSCKVFTLPKPGVPASFDPSAGILDRQLLRGAMPA